LHHNTLSPKLNSKNSLTPLWENEEEELKDLPRDLQEEEEDHQEEDPQLREEQQHNPSQRQQMSKPWAKTLPSLKEKGARPTPS